MRLLSVAVIFALFLMPLSAQKQISDDTIIDQVRVHLAGDTEVGGRPIDVEAKQGVVTLKGRVRNEKQRSKAEKIAKKVKGVSSVVNQLVITQE